MRIATWNINSLRLRMHHVERFVSLFNPDLICFQEIKCRVADFPSSPLRKMGYEAQAIHAQKGYHGVAIASRLPLTDISVHDFCGKGDARHVSAVISHASGLKIRIHNLYVPAGGEEPDPSTNEKFSHKLDFLDEMAKWSAEINGSGAASILVGDLNVAPLECDVWNHKSLLSVVSHTPAETERMNQILAAGRWLDAIRHRRPPPEKIYTWWSYRSPNWEATNKGRRLDHVWLCPKVAPLLNSVEIFSAPRSWERPSDHVPIIMDLM